MKYWCLAVICIFLVQPLSSQVPPKRQTPPKDPQETQQADTSVHNKLAPTVTGNNLINSAAPDYNPKPEQQESRREFKWGLTKAEFVMAGLTAVYVALTLSYVIISACTLASLRTQSRIAGIAANAAKNSADAAYLNAQAVINAERPWVSAFGIYQGGVFTFMAGNFGRTPAEVISYSTGTALVDRAENLPIPPQYGKEQKPPLRILTPGNTLADANITLATYDTNVLPAPDPNRQVFAFFFRIAYKNPLSNSFPAIPQYESRICFWYERKGGRFPEVGGPEEYNKHT